MHDRPQKSVESLVRSMKEIVRKNTGLEISVKREMWAGLETNPSICVISLPSNAGAVG